MESEIADLQNRKCRKCLYWSAEQVADWVSSLGLGQYRDCFLTNGINGRRLFLVDASNLPKKSGTEFQHVQARIYCPSPRHLGMYLEMKSKTGKSLDELTYDKFNAKSPTRSGDPPWRTCASCRRPALTSD
uniref:SAM domain-containing protein n=1 Tax=Macrostomum lignano TaxID=282301 RepID=A0A1I8FI67_9PLAT